MCQEYEGWSNYQTWAASLWIDNNEKEYQQVFDVCMNAVKTMDNAVYFIADYLKKYVEKKNPLNNRPTGMYHDLLQYSIDMIDYDEWAGHWESRIQVSIEYDSKTAK